MSELSRRAIALGGALACAMSLAACGGDSTPETPGASGASPANDAGEPITITYESWGPTQESMDAVIDAFQAANPGVTVQASLLPYADYITALKTELASGTGPDVFEIQAGGALKEFQSLLTPVAEPVQEILGQDITQVYKQSALDQVSIDGVAYGLPNGFSSAGMLWVNNSILDEQGIAVPTSYDELVAACKKLREAGIVPVAIGAKDDWMLIDIFTSMSNAIAPGEQYAAQDSGGKWTTDGLIKTFDAFATMFKDGVAMDGATGAMTYSDTYDLYADGKAAFFTNGSWNQDMYVGAKDRIGAFKSSVILMPTISGAAPVTAGIGGIYAVNKNSANPEAALKLAYFMSAGQGAQIMIDGNLNFAVTVADITPSGELSEDAAATRAELTDQLNNNLAGYREVPDAGVKTALGQELIKLAAGTTDGKAAAEAVQAAADDQ
ncbi:MAG: extracellular solute-binding protein [Bifidobacteriaceae bacterium]|jgi:raffinose/stachyose/melibiose transport system substrate-binding protein|nr:extracellular solute-binding protein [Bifidobacteriaceae bacterium]